MRRAPAAFRWTPSPTHALTCDGGRLRVDVEFAHQSAEPTDAWQTRAEVAGSAAVAHGMVARLAQHEEMVVVTSVLVDDKKNRSSALDERRRQAVAGCVNQLGADRVMLESELVRHLPAFRQSLPPDSPVPARFARRLACHGELACSQDIAIWHSLRLGLFRAADPRWAWHGPRADENSVADVCVAVLPRRFRIYEEKAYEQNFRHLGGAILRDAARTVLRGRHHGREVTLWAIWVDVRLAPAELHALGRAETAHLMRILALDRYQT